MTFHKLLFIGILSIGSSINLDLTPLGESRSTDQCGCGYSSKHGISACQDQLSRIIGGHESAKDEAPWMAFLTLKVGGKKAQICGGAILNTRFILTASHCVHNEGKLINASQIIVELGRNDFRQTEASRLVMGVDKVIPHELYNQTMIDNDIALLRLKAPIPFTDAISPICLPTNLKTNYAGGNAYLAGWGLNNTKPPSSVSEILLRTSLTVLESTHAYCFDGHNRSLPNSKLCAYGLNHDACFGDSGGPLIVEENGRCMVVGVVSYGFGCSTQFVAGVYTRVTEFMDWIKGHAAVGGCMEPKSSLKCDLSCTKVANYSGLIIINGLKSSCKDGICYALDTSKDLTLELKDPCNQGLKCSHAFQCLLRDVLFSELGNVKYNKIINTTLLSIPIECNTQTGYCCDLSHPKINLCLTLEEKLMKLKKTAKIKR